jgi:hypothetical protein
MFVRAEKIGKVPVSRRRTITEIPRRRLETKRLRRTTGFHPPTAACMIK